VPALTPEQLTQLRIATEHLLELPEAAQWDARGHERRTDEAKVKLAVFGLLNAINKAVGVRALADLVRQAEASADSDGKLPSYAESVVYAALMRQTPASALEEHVPRIVEALGGAALRSENAERELLGLEPIESLAKQFEYTGTALLFQDRYPALSGSVETYMADAVGNHAQAVTGKIVAAANPASPIGIGPLQRQLRGEVSDLTVKRATTIARTETARVYGETARGTFKANGITRARLVTAGDPCPECEAIAAQGFMPVDDLAELPIHPNCRCDYIPDVEGWLPPGEKTTTTDYEELLPGSGVMSEGPLTAGPLGMPIKGPVEAQRTIGKALGRVPAKYTETVNSFAVEPLPPNILGRTFLETGDIKLSLTRGLLQGDVAAQRTIIHETIHCAETAKVLNPKMVSGLRSRYTDHLVNLEKVTAPKGASYQRQWYLVKGNKSVSPYAMKNPTEYLAESVARYLVDPVMLKVRDPSAFDLIAKYLG